MSQHGSKTETNTVQSFSSLTALVPIWDSGEQTLLLSHDRTFRAGRGSNCDLVIAHPGVAEWHATVIRNGRNVTVQPEHGQHVWINDRLIDQPASVEIGDTLAIGPATFRIEARRNLSRSNSSRSKQLPDLSTRLEKQLNELQQQYNGDIQDDNLPVSGHGFRSLTDSFSGRSAGQTDLPPYSAAPAAASHATPFLDFAATTNRRTALDERETQLNEWHRSLDRRREELDKRSANLTRQQAALTARQTELDHRTAELELWHQVALEDIEDRKASLNTDAEADLRLQRAKLRDQEKQLLQEQEQVADQLRRMEDSRQSIADQLQGLEDARRSLKEERAELVEERSQLQSETEARQQADSAQEEAFQLQRQKLDDFAKQLEDERTQLHQQETSLRSEQERLENRSVEVAEAEERIQLASAAAQSVEASADEDVATTDVTASETAEQDFVSEQAAAEEAAAALLLLEEQKANLAKQQSAIQEQLESIQRKEGEFELLRADVEAQRHLLSDQQIALEFEKAEATSALEEAKRLKQEVEDAQADHQVDSLPADEVDAETDTEALHALTIREQELAERTEELANRLAELKSWKKQLEERELANQQQAAEEVQAAAPVPEDRPKSVLASQLSSLMMPAGMMPESDSLQDSVAVNDLAAAEQKNADLQSEATELRDRVADLELQLQAAEQESTSLSSLLHRDDENGTGRALTEQNLLAELQALKSDLSDSAKSEDDAGSNGEQVVVQSQIAELEARNQSIVEAHQQEVAKYESTIEQLNDQLELVQKQFESLEERAMKAVADAASKSAAGESQPQADVTSTDTEEDAANVSDSATAESTDADAAVDSGADQADETVLKLSQMVEQLSAQLEQRNSTISNLQAQLNGGIPLDSSLSMSPQEVKVLSQELDSRTVLLDEREAALRERERLLEHSEQELQAQRVALQEARQQLELARAEIHSAQEPAASESMLLSRDLIDSVTELAEAGATKPKPTSFDQSAEEEATSEDASQRSSVRSEIAELFGLGSKAKIDKPVEEPKKGPSTAAELMEAVDEYSQESAAAVSLSFESAQDMLMAPDSETLDDNTFEEPTADKPKDEADDVVASYMEQLLSRSRAKADGDAPKELKKTVPNKTVAEKPAAEKKPAGQASFIDKYMSGQYGTDKEPEAVVEAEVSDTTPAEDQLAKDESAELRRSKIDRDAQRLDLQSFRELSTQSAANALATHARRQQKGGITTRTTIVTTLGLICVFVLAAAVIGVIPFGWLTTLSIVAVAAAGGELAWKMKKIQEEANERAQLAMRSSESKTALPEAGLGAASTLGAVADSADSKIVGAAKRNDLQHSADAMTPVAEVCVPTDHPNRDHAEVTALQAVDSVQTEAASDVNQQPVADALSDATTETAADQVNAQQDSADASGPSQSTSDLLASLEPKAVTSDVASSEQPEVPAAVEEPSVASEDDDGGVPDAFNEAFRMLTSTSLPIKKAEPKDEQPKDLND